jgi:hypothetical protein
MIFFVFACMVLTAYRATRLVTKDDFPPLLWMRDRLAGGWRPLSMKEDEALARALGEKHTYLTALWSVRDDNGKRTRYVYRAKWSPYWLAELVTCPWCASAYLSGVLTLVVDLTYGLPVPWLIGPAVWASAALLGSREWA